MKRYMWVLPLVALMVMFGSFSVGYAAQSDNNETGLESQAGVTIGRETRGVVFYTATMHADGTIARCFGCVSGTTTRLGTGQYQVGFRENVQAFYGFSRWVQPDTLTTGTTNVFCDTADRAGVNTAVWVNCQDANGTPTDTNFFLFVAR